MRKYLLVIALFLSFTQLIKSQDSLFVQSFRKENIVGRWVEAERTEGEKTKPAGEFPDTYIFRDNMVFHKGEAAEGVIVFNITGKYEMEGDFITIYYNNYLLNKANRLKPKKIQFKILSVSDDEMYVMVKDYDYEYTMLLNKQSQ
ncbi:MULTISPECIES: hypothetical protein [Dysgonomonas]|uniref:Lipocalin-like domain-containing protein n=1 Tax=Dysgonomonas gadei ATCC BAA-286 TaxID=742766 RepID=F5J0Z7_9BACT|nr:MULTISPECIES: hypothetical protein [Dysgonomonas]EGK00740.1 hypothetical protein HMPREF9455_03014 [Dysgonomonas gadei ATCC BAA-286]MBF0648236.1 hypothetical protein [Dysgonomonas sp. GY75]